MTTKNVRLVEAALFSAGKPVTVAELSQAEGLDARTVRSALAKLQEEYEEADRAIEIAKIGPKYVMQVRRAYLKGAQPLAAPALSRELLKTAALIGYYQPILQSKLAALAGSGVYEHVKDLEARGLVRLRPKKKSFELSTTRRFLEAFGIDARSRLEVKAWFEAQLSPQAKV